MRLIVCHQWLKGNKESRGAREFRIQLLEAIEFEFNDGGFAKEKGIRE
jgi:hypothetical protein